MRRGQSRRKSQGKSRRNSSRQSRICSGHSGGIGAGAGEAADKDSGRDRPGRDKGLAPAGSCLRFGRAVCRKSFSGAVKVTAFCCLDGYEAVEGEQGRLYVRV